MLDMFTECLIKRRKHFKEYAVIFPLITVGLILTLAYYIFLSSSLVLSGPGLAVVVLVWWGIYLLISRKNIEFEYTVTNSDVDIDTIISQKTRKRLASFNAKEIELMAPIDQLPNEHFDKEIDASAHDDRYDVYFIIANLKGVRTKILLNPSKKILDILKTFRPQNIIIGEE